MQNKHRFRACVGTFALAFAGAGLSPAAQGADAPALDCAAASTQLQLNVCAHDEFLVTQAGMAEQLQRMQLDYSAAQRSALRRVQRAWLGYRTEACNFESSAAAGGSSQQMIRWQCTSRMTRERTAALASQAACREGDLSCVRPAGASSAPR